MSHSSPVIEQYTRPGDLELPLTAVHSQGLVLTVYQRGISESTAHLL